MSPAHAFEVFPRNERIYAVPGHQSVLSGIISRPSAGDPESMEGQTDQDVHVGDLDARVLATLYSSADRRVRRLVVIGKQLLDIGVGVHVIHVWWDWQERGVDLDGWA